jgi:hypothetical protein
MTHGVSSGNRHQLRYDVGRRDSDNSKKALRYAPYAGGVGLISKRETTYMRVWLQLISVLLFLLRCFDCLVAHHVLRFVVGARNRHVSLDLIHPGNHNVEAF